MFEQMVAKKTQRKGRRGGRREAAGRRGFIPDARRLSVDYPGEDLAALEQIAEERGVSVATIVREAVSEYLTALGRK